MGRDGGHELGLVDRKLSDADGEREGDGEQELNGDADDEEELLHDSDKGLRAVDTEIEAAEGTEDFPVAVLLLLYVIVCFDVTVLMVIVPFLPKFCAERLGFNGRELGAVVGSITSAYYLANALSSAWMGHLSDVHGRRPVLLAGMVVSIVTVTTFPVTSALWTALANRFLCGFFNSNITITKSALADLSRNWSPDRRTISFGYLGAAWGLSRFISSAFAGLTIGIKIPFLPFTEDNPYFFPCFAVSASLFVVCVVSWFYLPETRPVEDQVDTSSEKPEIENSILQRLRHLQQRGGPVLMRTIGMHMVHQFCNGGLITCLVLIWSQDQDEGGYGLSANHVGMMFMFFSLLGVVFQFTCFKWFSRALGVRYVYGFGNLFFATGAVLVWLGPKLVMLVSGPRMRVFVMMLASVPVSIGFVCGLPMLSALLSNASPQEIMGLAQGTAQSTGAFSRMLGPTFFGILFSYSTHNGILFLPFVLMSFGYLLNLLQTMKLPESVESPYEAQPAVS